jgi:small-conductance mechanosensitive channel
VVPFVSLQHVILPLSAILISLVAGMVVNKLIITKLRPKLAESAGPVLELVIKSLRGMPVLWCLIIGIYFIIYSLPLGPTLLKTLSNTLLVLIIFSATIVTARSVVGFLNLYAQRAVGLFPGTSIFVNLAESITYIIGVLIILQSLGISITPILTALGVGGLAVALALQDTLSNLFSGIHIILSRQIKIGDYIKLSSGEEGYIVDIAWRNTTIQAFGNKVIVVPNAKIASAIITNYNIPDAQVAVYVPVGVSYDSDLAFVEQVTLEVAAATMREIPGGVANAQPSLSFNAFAEYSITFNVVLQAKTYADQFPLKHEFIKRLQVRYRQEGIQIPYPVRTIGLMPTDNNETNGSKTDLPI